MMEVVVDPDVCVGCKTCVDMCPHQAIYMNDDKAVIDSNKCEEANVCINICPVEAIREKKE